MRTRLQAILAREDYATFVAENAGEVAGLIGAVLEPSYSRDGLIGRLMVMVVDEQARGRGLGAALVRRAEEWLRSRGAHLVMVNTAMHRQGAHDFYRRLGYTQTGIRFARPL